MVFVKTKKVRLKDGRIQEYYYLARSERIDGKPYPVIIKYCGKEKPNLKSYNSVINY